MGSSVTSFGKVSYEPFLGLSVKLRNSKTHVISNRFKSLGGPDALSASDICKLLLLDQMRAKILSDSILFE
ncbi:hypothetical protein [Asticcacaulis sp. W401b]|uniref:hypothetical protein n=1 Tax=Asticcacaulis sp. W401b TaxID=3388666 RepID=UPI0039708E46